MPTILKAKKDINKINEEIHTIETLMCKLIHTLWVLNIYEISDIEEIAEKLSKYATDIRKDFDSLKKSLK